MLVRNVFILIVLLLGFRAEAFGQRKVAVYVVGSQNSAINKVLGDRLVASFARSGEFSAVERSSVFLSELGREQHYQRTGAVSDSEISALGKQLGVEYVCVVEVLDVLERKYMSARLIDIENAGIVGAASAVGFLNGMSDVIAAADELAASVTKINRTSALLQVAVYVPASGNSGLDRIIGDRLVGALVGSGRYNAVERSSGFLAELGREQNYQRTGVVDDGQISRLGEQFGAQLVCVADITELFGETYVSVRLIDVESAEIVRSAQTSRPVASVEDILEIASVLGNVLIAPDMKTVEVESRKILEAEEERSRAEYMAAERGVPLRFDGMDEGVLFFDAGDIYAFRKWVVAHVSYPEIAAEENIQGRVYVSFVVCRDGGVKRVEVANKDRVSPVLALAVFRAVASSPSKWTVPDRERNYPVSMPVDFKLVN